MATFFYFRLSLKLDQPVEIRPQPVAICFGGVKFGSVLRQIGRTFSENATFVSKRNKAISLYSEGGL